MLSIKLFVLFLFLYTSFIISQENNPASFNTPENIIRFADYLFCTGDYFRASLEYDRVAAVVNNDSIKFKAALGYSLSGNYSAARIGFRTINQNNQIYSSALLEQFKIYLLTNEIQEISNEYNQLPPELRQPPMLKMLYSCMLLNDKIPDRINYSDAFKEDKEMLLIYERSADPESRSPVLAGVLSAVIPGAGKIYTGRYLDGVLAFISTGLLAFIAYDNFEAGHDTRAWIFTGLASLFYAGNIYGSASSASEFNRNVNAAIKDDLNSYLEKRNYFIAPYEFCK
jgi:TM2 domain-containing membrane protein YozV